jgi:hypothetical protein
MHFSRRAYRGLWYAFILSQSVVAALSLTRYFLDFDQVNEAIAKNANIDIIGNMSHIYFGLLLAISVVLGIYLIWRFVPMISSGERWVLGLI